KEVSDDEEVTQVKVLMALADDVLSVGKNRARIGKWIDITMRKVTIILSMDEDADWKNYLKYINIDLSEQIPNQKKKILEGELLSESSSKKDVNENLFIPASMGYNHEMVPKSKDWVERYNLDSKLSNFNTGRILVPKIQAVNECLKPTEASNDPESSKPSKSESLTLLPRLKIFMDLLQALRIVLLQADKSLDLYVSNYPVYSSVFRLQRLLVVGDHINTMFGSQGVQSHGDKGAGSSVDGAVDEEEWVTMYG
nr:retrovirus-related Pol polyprotein from transposon TNT 1-94 [Tanacetum cinerariifolium]